MAGKKCPKCNQLTFFINGRNGECKKCGYKMQVPANEGRGGSCLLYTSPSPRD